MPTWSALVVDDDPGIRQSLRLCLEADGARVLGVGTGAAALEAIDRGRFDVVAIVWPDDQGPPTVDHLRNAFEAVGRGQMFR